MGFEVGQRLIVRPPATGRTGDGVIAEGEPGRRSEWGKHMDRRPTTSPRGNRTARHHRKRVPGQTEETSMTDQGWWTNLTPTQHALYGGYIDSRVRLLGEYYGTAVERVRADDRIRAEVLAVTEATS